MGIVYTILLILETILLEAFDSEGGGYLDTAGSRVVVGGFSAVVVVVVVGGSSAVVVVVVVGGSSAVQSARKV